MSASTRSGLPEPFSILSGVVTSFTPGLGSKLSPARKSRKLVWAAKISGGTGKSGAAIIFPITPTFYNGQSTVESIVEEFAHRVLSIIGLKQTNKYEWNGASTEARKIHASQN